MHPGLLAALRRRPVKWMGRISFLLIFFPFPLPFPFPWDLLFSFLFFFSPFLRFPSCFLPFFLSFSLLVSFHGLRSAFCILTPLTVSIGQLGAAGYGERKSPCFCSLLFLGSLWFFSLFFMLLFLQARHYSYGCVSSHSLQFCKKGFLSHSSFFFRFFFLSFLSCFLSSVRLFFGGDRERGTGKRRKEGKACLSRFLVQK